MKSTDPKALARIAAADIQSANGDSAAIQRAIVGAMTAATSAARERSNHHTLSDGAVNALVVVGSAAATREVQNIVGDVARAFGGETVGRKARAIATRVLGLGGLLGTLATRTGTRANQVSAQALTVATLDVVDGVHHGVRQALVGGDGDGDAADGVMVSEVISPPH